MTDLYYVRPVKDDLPPKLAVRVREAAAMLSVSTTTIYGLIKAGRLQPVRVGNCTLIRVADLESILTR